MLQSHESLNCQVMEPKLQSRRNPGYGEMHGAAGRARSAGRRVRERGGVGVGGWEARRWKRVSHQLESYAAPDENMPLARLCRLFVRNTFLLYGVLGVFSSLLLHATAADTKRI